MCVPYQCHANAMPMSWWCHANGKSESSAMPMPYPGQVGFVSAISSLCASCQCHAHARSMSRLFAISCAMSVQCQCHVNATSVPRQCHVMPHHCALMAHTILAVPYLKPNRGWASPCPTCISSTINHTEPCECNVRAMSVPCQCHFSAALSMPWQCHANAMSMPCQCNVKCHVNVMSSQCRCCSLNKTCMSENQHQGSMYI